MPRHGETDARENWQAGAVSGGDSSEVDVHTIITRSLPSGMRIMRKPKCLHTLFFEMDYREHPEDYAHSTEPGAVWYDEEKKVFMKNRKDGKAMKAKGGMEPDIIVENPSTGKSVVVEVKRQNAAGNAHERMFRYIPLIPEMSRRFGTKRPFMGCVCGTICEDSKYRAEIRSSFACHSIGDCVHLVRTEDRLVEWVSSTLVTELM